MAFASLWKKLKDEIDESIVSALKRNEIIARLASIEHKIDLMEHFGNGSRGTYVGNNRVLVKSVVANRQIAFFVEADDRLLSPWFIVTGGYETQLTDFFVRVLKPDSRCIDVGANFGYFTCLMARFCPDGRVIGVEADQHVYEIARDNVFINGFQDFASVVHAAAGDSGAEATLHRRKTRSANTSIAKLPDDFIRAMGEPESEAFVVQGVRIDDLASRLDNRVDFIKIDVEGAEPLVFEGAKQTIAANPALVIVAEWSPGQIQAAGFEVPAFLASLEAQGLRAYDIAAEQLSPLSYAELLNLPYRAGIVLKRAE